jgi:phosphohistidine phosphatase
MDLWLLRHAAAEDRSESGDDRERALTSDGLRRARRVGRGFAILEPEVAAIWISPYRRARQTAAAVAGALRFREALHETEALAPECDPQQVLEELDASGPPGAVLLVGHQPHLGALLGLLVARDGAEIPLKKASVAGIERVGRRSGTLRALLPPDVMERLAAGRGRTAPVL